MFSSCIKGSNLVLSRVLCFSQVRNAVPSKDHVCSVRMGTPPKGSGPLLDKLASLPGIPQGTEPRALRTYEFYPAVAYGAFQLIDKLIQDVGANDTYCNPAQVRYPSTLTNLSTPLICSFLSAPIPSRLLCHSYV